MLSGTSATLAHSQTGPLSSKRRRAMAQLKQIPVSMLSGFLGSGAIHHSMRCSPMLDPPHSFLKVYSIIAALEVGLETFCSG